MNEIIYGEYTPLTQGDLNKDFIKYYTRSYMATIKPIKIMVGHSGSGKNFLPEIFGLRVVPGCTTRQPRENDVGYTYFNKADFAKIDQTTIVCKTHYCGNDYWMRKVDFENAAYDYAVVDLNGVKDLEEAIANKTIRRPVDFIFFKSSIITRIKNMRARNDPWKKVRERLFNDFKSFKGGEEYIKKLGGTIIKV